MSTTPPPTPLISHISSNIFLHVPSSLSPAASSSSRTRIRANVPSPVIIFFVTGNPGLIGYYHAFLAILSISAPARGCVIAGFSLGGFEIDDDGIEAVETDLTERHHRHSLEQLQFPPEGPDRGCDGKQIYGLEAQIELTERRVRALSRRLYGDYCRCFYSTNDDDDDDDDEKSESRDGTSISSDRPRVQVILLGHSVGAYIVLELIRRHAQQQQQGLRWRPKSDVEDYGDDNDEKEAGLAFEIKGAILLTPTVIDIAQSASGRLLTPLVTYIPSFAALVAGAARGLVKGMGRAWLRELVRRVTGMPDQDGTGDGEEGGMSALDATVAFLTSKRGVRQALEMAGDEMRNIREDRWGEEVWGVGSAVVPAAGDGAAETDDSNIGKQRRSPTLVFYFARADHWVADQTREELLKVRGRVEENGEDWKPKMVVDVEDGLVHGWCIGQSELVAGKVGKWITEIVGDREDAEVRK